MARRGQEQNVAYRNIASGTRGESGRSTKTERFVAKSNFYVAKFN
jgi:hypothetical protein